MAWNVDELIRPSNAILICNIIRLEIMSKTEVKKYLNTLEKKQIIEVVMDLYDAGKESKEFLEYYIHPDEKAKLKEYKAIILNEFFPKRGDGKCRFSVCKKAISDFKKLHPSPESQADLMLYLVEQACIAADLWGDMWESFYESTENNFDAVMKFMDRNDLIDGFKPRIEALLKNTESSGYGFCDSMPGIYYSYANDEE